MSSGISVREDIHQKLLALLDAMSGSIPTDRNPEVPVDWEGLGGSKKFVVLLDGGQPQPPKLENSAELIRTMTPAIEGYVRDDNSAIIGTLLEGLRVQCLTTVLADRTLGGLSWDVREGELEAIEVNRENESGPSGSFRQIIEVDYVTAPDEF